MLFVRYESWRQYLKMYPVNSLIVAICIVMFGIELGTGGYEGMNLLRLGAVSNFEGYDEPWRNVTALFLHGSWPHLIFNMFNLIVFAAPLERMFGHIGYGIFYLAVGFLGNWFALLMANGGWYAVGASTAIYGVYGAYLFICMFQRNRLDQSSRTTVYGILGIGLIYSFIAPNIGYWAHIGGLVMGFALFGLIGTVKAKRAGWR